MHSTKKISVFGLAILLGLIAWPAGMGICADAHPGKARFDKMDANGDGKVVLEEFTAAFPGMTEKAFMVIDKNGDNGVDRAEWYDFTDNHSQGSMEPDPRRGAPMNNIPGDPLIPPPDSSDLPLMRPPLD